MASKSISIKLNLWVIVGALVASNLVTVFLWRPWNAPNRTIDVVGTAKVDAKPDQYTFYPNYEKTGQDQKAINEALNQKTSEVTAKLKELGVAEEKIKAVSSVGPDYSMLAESAPSKNLRGSVNFTVRIKDKELAEKVKAYLTSSDLTGQLTPIAEFSEELQKTLEADLREKAIADAKRKGDQTAKELSAKLGKAITIGEASTGPVFPMPAYETKGDLAVGTMSSGIAQEALLDGENMLSLSINIKFQLK